MTKDMPVAEWRILVIEDDPQMRSDVDEYFSKLRIAERPVVINFVEDFERAIEEIRQRRADLIILDVFQGPALTGARPFGIEILEAIKQSGFICVVLFTAHPEKVAEYESPFVRLVGKDVGSLELLQTEVLDLFSLRIPHVYRGIATHFDNTLRDYMWGFVEANWEVLSELARTPEFLRVILQRFAATFARERVHELLRDLFGEEVESPIAPECVHPAEFYVMPPIDRGSVLLGDIRVVETNSERTYLVVLWPSCDLVDNESRKPKTDRVLCARAGLLEEADEVVAWKIDPSKNREQAVRALVMNNRRIGQAERYHTLPGLCTLPDLLVDFQRVEPMSLENVRGLPCPATLASPFAESLASRYLRYLGRLGTPDLDPDLVLQRLGAK